jgi:hypothetical protein
MTAGWAPSVPRPHRALDRQISPTFRPSFVADATTGAEPGTAGVRLVSVLLPPSLNNQAARCNFRIITSYATERGRSGLGSTDNPGDRRASRVSPTITSGLPPVRWSAWPGATTTTTPTWTPPGGDIGGSVVTRLYRSSGGLNPTFTTSPPRFRRCTGRSRLGRLRRRRRPGHLPVRPDRRLARSPGSTATTVCRTRLHRRPRGLAGHGLHRRRLGRLRQRRDLDLCRRASSTRQPVRDAALPERPWNRAGHSRRADGPPRRPRRGRGVGRLRQRRRSRHPDDRDHRARHGFLVAPERR